MYRVAIASLVILKSWGVSGGWEGGTVANYFYLLVPWGLGVKR